ncbi:MAG: 4-(cytidine 5'-diphospho)-2-C-methyl-D-erythritol kinase [Candidatus Subteraquimicrobiales bacterium]|nr:4-(cytidine 5'-diphospho)-2-C-methyl-D-erythritol kinase [Candidatus Subteraquimicrobiales bacterium]
MILKAHAKINFYLDVLSRRSDGYHNIQSVMQSLELADVIFISPNLKKIEVILNSSDFALDIPSNDNLAYKAATLLKNEAGLNQGAIIEINKRIPVAAGLGGGSADAAAVLFGLNLLWGLNLPLEKLQQIGAKVGADVPFCLIGGTSLAEGVGEILNPLPQMPSSFVVIAKPSFGISTAEIYNELDKIEISPLKQLELICASLEKKDLVAISRHLNNILEKVAGKLYPEIIELKEIAMEAGALGALMSGSGPSVFALAKEKKAAEKVLEALKPKASFVLLTRCFDCGVELV